MAPITLNKWKRKRNKKEWKQEKKSTVPVPCQLLSQDTKEYKDYKGLCEQNCLKD